ncbi:unnamed protein product [Mesocestoides corti]|uniref:Uncharacterized protein n=1 Tax=Mesocestoides corti TaxID=53468 RepID=A0A3P6HJ16_MESCO|nr:unnamed protein product [Mesocestoides corti]
MHSLCVEEVIRGASEEAEDFSGRSTSSVRLRGKQRRTYQSESRSSRAYLKPIPRQSVVHLAQASVPRRRAESVAMGVLAQSHLSALGSQLFTSAAGGIENIGGRGMVSTLELAEGAPVIVELPHESITVEDYARPLYRKDIFFPGSVKRQIDASAASIATAAANVLDPSNEQVGNSQASMAIQDELRRRKVCVSGTSQFGSSILFGDNVPLPPINESSVPEEGVPGDANWTGSCLMSLTKIPLPDVFENKEATSGTDSEAYLWDRLRAETGLNLSDTPADGIYRVPRSHSLCGWWLCWKTQRTHSLDRGDMDSVERLKRALMEDGDRAADKKFSRRAHLVLRRKCDFLPKSMCDVLVTMMNLSLLKSKSFLLFCLASLIAMTGAYVPLFFVCDLADSFNIPKSQSAYLLTVYVTRQADLIADSSGCIESYDQPLRNAVLSSHDQID